MKILYNEIKRIIPGLKRGPEEVANALTLIGLMAEGLGKVRYQNKIDYLISLEVRQNRPDCLSVIGIAREIAGYYGLKVKLPENSFLKPQRSDAGIKVESTEHVIRIIAVRLKNLKNSESPKWLKEFLSFYNINSINLLVDLSNYVMLLTGYPSHLFDADKLEGNISWALNKEFNQIITLDGTNLKLNKGELIIKDKKNIVGLAGIIGGKTAEIDLNTKTVLLEIAVYNHAIIRRNCRELNMITEASNRLTKDLDPNGVNFAARYLISVILKTCKGEIDSEIFDYYPKKHNSPKIKFNPQSPSTYAGVNIPEKKVVEILKNLDFQVKKEGKNLKVSPPVNRKDISLPEDLVEEVVRIFGYNKIPSQEVPQIKVTGNITPKNITLGEKVRDILSIMGFDEILSWPLTKKGENDLANYLNWESVSAENAINEDYPELRQSMVTGLNNLSKEYIKKNIKYVRIFEIGKVFGKVKNNYKEHESVGILLNTLSNEKKLSFFKENLERLLRSLGVGDISYKKMDKKLQIAVPRSCWSIMVKEKLVGILYKLKTGNMSHSIYFAELNLSELTKILSKIKNKTTVELTYKLVVLDANVELKKDERVDDYLKKIRKKIKESNIWDINIVDEFSLKEKTRFTVRVSYKNLSDKEAKKIHEKAFNLK